MTSRAIGNLARVFYPDGIDGNPSGPLAKPMARVERVLHRHAARSRVQRDRASRRLRARARAGCAEQLHGRYRAHAAASPRWRRSRVSRTAFRSFRARRRCIADRQLVGAVGVSGDGVDQDDMIAFLGIQDAANRLGSIRPGADGHARGSADAVRRASCDTCRARRRRSSIRMQSEPCGGF